MFTVLVIEHLQVKLHMLNMKEDLVCNSLKGFDVSTDFVFKQGNYTYNYMWSNMNADGNAPTRNQAVNAFDYWTPIQLLPQDQLKTTESTLIL
jgi:hypothetical protein